MQSAAGITDMLILGTTIFSITLAWVLSMCLILATTECTLCYVLMVDIKIIGRKANQPWDTLDFSLALALLHGATSLVLRWPGCY